MKVKNNLIFDANKMKTRFKLRPWCIDDLENLFMHANNAKIAEMMMDRFPHPYTLEAGKAFIEFATKDNPIHIFAIEIDGVAVGGIGIHPQEDVHKKNAELGYWLSEKYWGLGIMSSAILQMIPFAFETFPINRLFAKTFGNNTASQHILEKCGFKKEAHFHEVIYKNGLLQDELIYAVRR